MFYFYYIYRCPLSAVVENWHSQVVPDSLRFILAGNSNIIHYFAFLCFCLRKEFHFSEVYLHLVACKVNEPRRGSCKLS